MESAVPLLDTNSEVVSGTVTVLENEVRPDAVLSRAGVGILGGAVPEQRLMPALMFGQQEKERDQSTLVGGRPGYLGGGDQDTLEGGRPGHLGGWETRAPWWVGYQGALISGRPGHLGG